MTSKKFDIIDCTLRDGSYLTGFVVPPHVTTEVVGALDSAGLKYIEVGHGVSLGSYRSSKNPAVQSDAVHIKAAMAARKKAMIGCFLMTHSGNMDDLSAARDLGLDFVRIGMAQNSFMAVEPYVKHAKKLGYKTFVNLYAISRVKKDDLKSMLNTIASWGVEALYFADSWGSINPSMMSQFTELCSEFRGRLVFGFHGHNHLQMAMANSLHVIEAGFGFVDATLRGAGREAGNTQTEVLLGNLMRLGIETGIDLKKVLHAAERIEKHFPVSNLISSSSIATAATNMDGLHMTKVKNIAAETGCNFTELVFGLHENQIPLENDTNVKELATRLAGNKTNAA